MTTSANTPENTVVIIDHHTYELVPFFDHYDQQWLLALRPIKLETP